MNHGTTNVIRSSFVLVIVLVMVAPAFMAPAVTFPGSNLGIIPDGTGPCWNPGVGAPRDVNFAVSGLSGSPTRVEVSVTFGSPNHTWVGDITATLIAPNGASHTLFGRTLAVNATSPGDSSDLGGTYTFSDTAPAPPNGGWWQSAASVNSTTVIPGGTYRTTNSGGVGATNPMPPTNMNAAFAGVPDANGTWKLRLVDGCADESGGVTAASLAINTATVIRSRADFDGDTKTDLSLFRPNEGTWYINGSTNGFTAVSWGQSTDLVAPGDFDGDGKADVATYRPSTGQWWLLRSSSGLYSTFFGVSGDKPVVGDYDGDGTSDIAVHRPSTNTWHIQLTGAGPGGVLTSSFGSPGDLPARADYDGDGKTDIAIYRPSNGEWWIAKSTGGLTAVTFGSPTDRPVPADYDGDGKDDVAIWRPSSGQWWIVSSLNGGVSVVAFGASTDVPVPGDYDGDGKDDQAIYRDGVWWQNRSAGGIVAHHFGFSTDIPIPSTYIPQ